MNIIVEIQTQGKTCRDYLQGVIAKGLKVKGKARKKESKKD